MLTQGKEYQAAEMARVYQSYPNKWLLLQILETDVSGRAKRLKLIRYADSKDELYHFLMDEMEDWDWKGNFIFVYSDPDKQCELY